jgi:hypothetical protein
MSKEKSIAELRKEIKQRFMALSEEEKNIIRENKNTPYGIVLKKILGDELLLGLRTADGKQLLNKGGRVGFSNGSSGQDYWITVQEMYDNAGGEAGTGLGLIDFANKYFPKMANGGRVGMAGGGVSQGLDYLMGIERRGYAVGGTGPRMIDGVSQEGILPGFIKRRSEFYNADGTINQEKIKAANFFYNADGTVNQVIPPTEFYYERIGKGGIGEGGGYDPKTYERIVAGQYPNIYDPSKNTVMGESGGIITDGGLKYRINADGSRTLLDTPTAGLYQTTNPNIIGYSPSEPAITALPKMSQEQAQVDKDLSTSINPLDRFQSHVDFNQELINKVKSDELSREDYNIIGGYDVAQKVLGPDFAITNPVSTALGIGATSGIYNAIQALKGEQNWSEIPGTVLRNVQGGSGLLSDRQKQSYQDIRNQYETQRQKSAFERFTGAAGPLAENINTAISSLNPFQKQQYMNYAVQNPDQAIAAAQRNKDFLAATQKNTNPATPAPASMADGGRVFYLQGGLASLLG